MVLGIYSIYDKKTKVYSTIMLQTNDAEAQRTASVLKRSRERLESQYPEDYQIVKVGEFNDSTGEVKKESVKIIAELSAIETPNGV